MIADKHNVALNGVVCSTFIVLIFGSFSRDLESVDVDEAVVGFFAEYADHIVQAVGDDSEIP